MTVTDLFNEETANQLIADVEEGTAEIMKDPNAKAEGMVRIGRSKGVIYFKIKWGSVCLHYLITDHEIMITIINDTCILYSVYQR